VSDEPLKKRIEELEKELNKFKLWYQTAISDLAEEHERVEELESQRSKHNTT
jgi:hypothetical protein